LKDELPDRAAREAFEDVVSLTNGFGWHWSFYVFRENERDAMDYEPGTGKLP